MSMQMRLELRLSQQLVMTPQLQMAIKLLQLSRTELAEEVREQLLENPFLEDDAEAQAARRGQGDEVGSQADRDAKHEAAGVTEIPVEGGLREGAEVGTAQKAIDQIDWESYLDKYSSAPPMPSFRSTGEDLPSLEATLTRSATLFEHLSRQLDMAHLDDAQRRIGLMILGNLNRHGYLSEPPLAELAQEADVELEVAEEVLQIIQQFDPVGIAARSLAECLLVQAIQDGQDDHLVVKILKDHLSNLEKKNYRVIARDLGEPLDEIYEAVKAIMQFDPRPGRAFSGDDPRYITPDVYVHKVGNDYFVVANDDGLPKLKISNLYRSAFRKNGDARDYVRERLRSAQWLIRSIEQRRRTIVRVTESILKFQRAFFEGGSANLKPLILRDVAEDISMHESTISRVTSNKYVQTPQGIFELKFFFSTGIACANGEDLASQAVKLRIKEIIGAESPRQPFSDQKIVDFLKVQDISIARRTVAKYREQMGILSSSKRRSVF